MKRRQFLAGAAGALFAGACSRGSLRPGVAPPALSGTAYAGRPVVLSFWNGFTGGDGPPMRAMVAEFNAAHPAITVVMNATRWNDYYRKMPVAVASGRGPDVGVLQQHRLTSAAARGVIVPLDALAREFGFEEGGFFPPAWRGGTYRGQRYGIPLDVHPLGMFFNARAFADAGIAAAPATRAEFDDALGRLRAKGFEHPFWIPTAWPAHLMFESLLWQHGGAPFSEDGSAVTFSSDAGARAIEWMRDMVQRGYSPRAVAADAPWNAFVNGTNAIAWDGIWMLQNARDVPGGAGVAPLPRIGAKPAVWSNAHQLVVFGRPRPDAARVQAAMVFIEWISQHSLEWARAGQIPARSSVRETPAFRAMKGQAAFAQQLADIRLLPLGPGIGELQDDTLLFAVDAALRSRTPRAELAEAEALANDELQTLRAPFT